MQVPVPYWFRPALNMKYMAGCKVQTWLATAKIGNISNKQRFCGCVHGFPRTTERGFPPPLRNHEVSKASRSHRKPGSQQIRMYEKSCTPLQMHFWAIGHGVQYIYLGFVSKACQQGGEALELARMFAMLTRLLRCQSRCFSKRELERSWSCLHWTYPNPNVHMQIIRKGVIYLPPCTNRSGS